MSGHKPFAELTRHSSPERNVIVAAETDKLREKIKLQELQANSQQEEPGRVRYIENTKRSDHS